MKKKKLYPHKKINKINLEWIWKKSYSWENLDGLISQFVWSNFILLSCLWPYIWPLQFLNLGCEILCGTWLSETILISTEDVSMLWNYSVSRSIRWQGFPHPVVIWFKIIFLWLHPAETKCSLKVMSAAMADKSRLE